MLIRPETAAEIEVIAALNRAAFDGPLEAEVVNRLRQDGILIASLVAEDGGEIIGHILFSDVVVRGEVAQERTLASLAPMAVKPGRQRQGVGSELVREGIEVCRQRGYDGIIVVGHPTYYPRFGFSHEVVSGLKNPFSSDSSFMGLELSPGGLSRLTGMVVYPAAFDVFTS